MMGGPSHSARVKPRPYTAPAVRTGRNHPCPCGSGLKYKQCCMFDVEVGHVRVGLDRIHRRVVIDFGGAIGTISLDPKAASIVADAISENVDRLGCDEENEEA